MAAARSRRTALAQLPEVLPHPLARRLFSPAATRLRALRQQRMGLLAAYGRVPQTLYHRDAFGRNLFDGYSAAGQACTIAFDRALPGAGRWTKKR